MHRNAGACLSRGSGGVPGAAAALLMALLGAAAAVPGFAITDEEIYGALRFPIALPSARTAAMGGAGLALCEGAAASRINPARLGSIAEPELVLEGRMRRFDEESGDSGLVLFDPAVHPFAGTSTSSFASTGGSSSPSFLGFAYPIRLSRPLGLSIARAEALDVSISQHSVTRTTPPSVPVTSSGGDFVERISRGNLDLDSQLYHVAAGWRLTPVFSVGGALVVGTMHLRSETTGLLSDPLQLTRVGEVDPRFSSSRAEPLYVTTSKGSDRGVGFVFGSWWKPMPSLAFATTYRRGPRFEIPSESRDLSTGAREDFTNVVKVPDAAAAGVVWMPFLAHPSAVMQSLTFALDLERVEYSDLLQGLRGGESILTRSDSTKKVSYTIEDATEARFGFEASRSFLTWTLAMRGGLYSQHDGRLHMDEITDPNGPFRGQGRALQERGFPQPDSGTLWHGTLGAGVSFYSFSWDLAADLSADDSRVVMTGAYRFQRR